MPHSLDSPSVPDPFVPDAERRLRAEDTFWSILGTLFRWRRFIIGVTGVVAVLAVVISLLMANWYQAQTRLMLPSRGGVGLISSAFLDNLPSSARSLLGGAGGDYARYLSILSSRTMYEQVVGQFDLVTVYDLADSPTPQQDAVEMLASNVDFLVDDEYEHLTVAVLDTDPERAAAMANFFVDELERINSGLASKSASNFRGFVEQRYTETEAALDSVLTAIRTYQETYGVLELETQGEQYLGFLAELRIAALQAEAEYETLLSQYGAENPLVKAARQTEESANRKYRQALEGRERLLPIAQDELPRVALGYVELERERLILSTILEYIRPVLEEARFDEERQVEAVQVIDVAVPPVKKSKPRRSVICIVATLSAFLIAVLFALVYSWWDANHARFAARLHRAVARSADGAGPPTPPEAPVAHPTASS